VSTFVIQALLGQDITVYGDGSQTRSFCYVDDLIDGLVRLMKMPADVTGPINIGNSSEFTMLGLAEMIMELTNSRSKIVYRPLPQDDPKQRRPDISRASTEFHWSPRVGLRGPDLLCNCRHRMAFSRGGPFPANSPAVHLGVGGHLELLALPRPSACDGFLSPVAV
jgi:UDP-glucose 4-epimerase